jgi:N utilization substance protein A
MNAMSPAEVESVVVDEDTHSMDIIVAEEKQLAQAIGKGGQNVQLASRLTGWTLNVMTKTQAQAQRGQEDEDLRQMFVEQLGRLMRKSPKSWCVKALPDWRKSPMCRS